MLPEITFPAPAVVPPIRTFGEVTTTPPKLPLPAMAAVPVVLVPILFPRIWRLAADEISTEVGGNASYEATETKSGPVATSANGHRDDHTRHGRRNRGSD